MAGKKRPEEHKQALLKALENHMGIVSKACAEVGISRDMFYYYCKGDENFKRAVDELNELQIDFAESQLLKNIAKGDRASIMFFLKYKARSRGYAESHIVDANVKIEQPLLMPLDDDKKIKEENGKIR